MSCTYPALGRSLALAVLLACAARADDEAPPRVDVDVSLRLYAVLPKFRLREGSPARAGSSLRTQHLGLDDPAPALGLRAGAWLDDHWLGVEGWVLQAHGGDALPRDAWVGGRRVAAGAPLRLRYHLAHGAVEYLHRLRPLGDLAWVDAGARVEALEVRADLSGVGRTHVAGAWPTLRLHVGLRPAPWLELEGRFGGFEVTHGLTPTRVTRPSELGGLVRVRLPGDVVLEAGALMLHVHLERRPGSNDEDVLHLRHRAAFLAVGVRF